MCVFICMCYMQMCLHTHKYMCVEGRSWHQMSSSTSLHFGDKICHWTWGPPQMSPREPPVSASPALSLSPQLLTWVLGSRIQDPMLTQQVLSLLSCRPGPLYMEKCTLEWRVTGHSDIMCMCVCIYMYTHKCVSMYVCMCVYIYTLICVCLCMYVCVLCIPRTHTQTTNKSQWNAHFSIPVVSTCRFTILLFPVWKLGFSHNEEKTIQRKGRHRSGLGLVTPTPLYHCYMSEAKGLTTVGLTCSTLKWYKHIPLSRLSWGLNTHM